jgi:tetratricopeptide (TPR) repeat protein
MNSNSNNTKHIKLNPKVLVGAAVGIVIVVGLIVFLSGPKPAWFVKLQIKSYLKSNSGKSNFAADFKFPPKSEMEKAPEKKKLPDEKSWRGSQTKKDFYTLRDEYIKLKLEAFDIERDINEAKLLIRIANERLANKKDDPILLTAFREISTNALPLPSDATALQEKVKSLENEIAEKSKLLAAKEEQIKPLLADLIEYQLAFKDAFKELDAGDNSPLSVAQNEFIRNLQQKFDEATTYAKMYEYIGQELWVAERLFESKNPTHLLAALRMARQAARDAMEWAQNYWLAARIYEAYILPNVEIAGISSGAGNRRNRFTIEGLLNECVNAFQMNEEQENEIRAYKMLLALVPDSPRADFVRVQLASIYDERGDTGKAEKYIKQIQNTNNVNFIVRRFPNLQKYMNK